jgi:retron-type reverse transcriptase
MSLRLEKRLRGMSQCSKNGERVKDIFKCLVNIPELWDIAYVAIGSNSGATTKGVDEVTVDGQSEDRNHEIMNQLRNGTYQPKPVRRTYIPKRNGKMRPLGIPSFPDKLVQSAAKIILEAVYEPAFCKYSVGFRPKLGCHDAIRVIQKKWIGTKWFIEFDIKGFFDNIDHDILIKILEKKIDDKRFIALIRKMLKAGYVDITRNEDGNKFLRRRPTYSGTPQGGIISPILANIYLNELDSYIMELCNQWFIGKKRKLTRDQERLNRHIHIVREYLDGRRGSAAKAGSNRLFPEGTTRDEMLRKLVELKKERSNQPSLDEMDPGFRRLHYVRYADDFLLGFIGSRREAEGIMREIKEYLKNTLLLECSEEKTKISDHKEGTRFLGYDLRTPSDSYYARKSKARGGSTIVKRTNSAARIQPYVPESRVKEYIDRNSYGVIQNLREWKGKARNLLINNSDYAIVTQYNQEVRGFCNYYYIAKNFYQGLHRLYYLAEVSMMRTLAGKHKSSKRKLYKKLAVTSNGDTRITVTENGHTVQWFKLKDIDRSDRPRLVKDEIYNPVHMLGRSDILQRLNARVCESCGKDDGYFEVHHVRKLKDLKERHKKTWWEHVMIARNRKTLVLCVDCHDKLHSGTLPDYRFTKVYA